jgi:hypothetical protein
LAMVSWAFMVKFCKFITIISQILIQIEEDEKLSAMIFSMFLLQTKSREIAK